MSSAAAKPRLTPEEYLAIERKADYKSEYFAGEIFAMTGASRRHNLIVGNTTRELGNLLKKRPCQVYPTDMRVKIAETGLYTYPDVVVICGTPEFEDESEDVLLNPTLVIEVLSESTEAYDRGKKFEHYRHIPSLAEYLLIAQDRCRIEQFTKQNDGKWLFSEVNSPDAKVKLLSIDCELSVAEVYDKVEFEKENEKKLQPGQAETK
jgi:Uma2 family endonuclease